MSPDPFMIRIVPHPKPIAIEYPKHECYFCRRTEEDLKNLVSVINEDLDKKINSQKDMIRDRLKETETNYQSIIDQLCENEYRNLKIMTLKTDPAEFEKLIPNLQIIIDNSEYNDETVSMVVSRLKERLEEISCPEFRGNDIFPEIKEAYDTIQSLEKKKQQISNSLGLRSKCVKLGHNTSVGAYTRQVNKNEIKIQICGICSGIFEEASDAAYSVLDDSYDD